MHDPFECVDACDLFAISAAELLDRLVVKACDMALD
jgi:hypothetical protein